MRQKKSILITGAASGIGKETVKLFAANGWLVGAADINQGALDKLVREVPKHNIIPIQSDVTSSEGASQMVQSFLGHTEGKLDCLFNCAGVLFMGPHESLTAKQKRAIVEVNVNGIINCVDAAFTALKNTANSHVVSMCSASSEFGAPYHAVYAATKAFVKNFTEALNIEYEHHGIQISDILVAYVQTPMVYGANVKPKSIEKLGVKVKPEQVALRVWDAAHGKRIHWYVGADSRLLNIVVRLLGQRSRLFYKVLTGS